MLFFAIVYVAEGLGQARVGVIWQPLNYYLKQVAGWSPVQISASLALVDLPWIIKPVWGLVSDFLPLFGYRRRAYLLLAGMLAILAYACVGLISNPAHLVAALLVTSFAMAAASTICGALLVENGQRYGASAAFVNQQWLWFNVATMAAAVGGGQLLTHLAPLPALHAAAWIAALAPVPVLLAVVRLVHEERSALAWPELRRTLGGLLAALRSRRLYLIGGFLFLYYFSPGFGTPLYFHLTDELHFPQSYIGTLNAIGAGGWIAGALLYRTLLSRLTLFVLLNVSILGGTLATLAYLLLHGEASAAAIYFANGVAAMIANVATLTLAAETCPPRAEGFVFAALLSLVNLTTPVADTIGSFLYERVFGHFLPPLVVVSAAATALVFALVPLLRLGRESRA